MTLKDIDLNSNAWCDMMFEGRNQQYGAYQLRKTSSKRHLLSLGIVILLVGLILLPMVIDQQSSEKEVSIHVTLTEPRLILHEAPMEVPVKPAEKQKEQETESQQSPILDSQKNETLPETPEDPSETSLGKDSTGLAASLSGDSLSHQQNAAKTDTTGTIEEPEVIESVILDPALPKPDFLKEYDALVHYFFNNIQYPEVALKQRIEGVVEYSFILNKDGSISNIVLEKSASPLLDEVVLGSIQTMPKWKPAVKNGKVIRIKYYLPIRFKL